MSGRPPNALTDYIVDHVGVGLFAVNRDMRLLLWNRFMQLHSGYGAEQVLDRNLFECFPELPRKWLERKIAGVFALKNFAFTSWEQRPHLFRFSHDRPITGGIDFMQQNCIFMPLIGASGEVEAVCVTLFDVTDMSLIQRQLEQALAALKESVNIDGLTEIYNRRHLETRLAEEFARHKRYGGMLSLLMFDLDHFKRINDRYGHLAGDSVLRSTARRVAEAIRTADVFGRYGGEEFALILPETGLSAAMVVAEKLRAAIGEVPIEVDDLRLQVTASFGVSVAHPRLPNYEALIREVDAALYTAKEQGRNRSVASIAAGTPASPPPRS